jgi:hypothetical protein
MNVRFRQTLSFRAGYCFSDHFRMNLYTVNLSMITTSGTGDDHGIALARMQHLFESLDSSIFVEHTNREKIDAFTTAGLNVIALPEPPIDQIIGIILFKKLNAIFEGRLRVTEIGVSSELGEDIEFLHSENETVPSVSDSGWWGDPGPKLSDKAKGTAQQNVVKIKKVPSWKSLDLMWSDQDNELPTETVIFTRKDDS